MDRGTTTLLNSLQNSKATYEVAKWGSHRYGRCTILQANVTYRGMPMDFEQFRALTDRFVVLFNNTKLAREDCEGSITLSAPGISREIVLSLREIHYMSVEKRDSLATDADGSVGPWRSRRALFLSLIAIVLLLLSILVLLGVFNGHLKSASGPS